MVASGWAVAYRKYSLDYLADEERAHADKVQIPTQAGHLFRFDRGHPSDLKPATIPI